MWTLRALISLLTAALVLWASGERHPYAMRLVATDEFGGGDATISPDGRRFVTSSRRTGDWELWIYDMDTQRWTQVTHDPGEDFEGKWSPDGAALVFTSSRANQKDVWAIDLRTGAERRLTTSPEDDEYPAWSPDGKWVVYTGGPWNARDFFVVSAGGGGEPRRVTRTSGRAGACTFEATPETLVCHRYDNGTGDLERVWVRDGDSMPLTSGSAWDYKPTTSPDARLIAFSRSIEGPSHIWLLPAAGGRAWQLTDGPGDDRWPTWSGDARHVLFHRSVDASLGVEALSGDGEPRTVVPESERPLQASRAPGGDRIAYCAETPAGQRVRLRAIAGGPARDVVTDGREACFPRWSPAGDRLALVVRNGTRWDVAVAAPDGAGMRVLTAAHPELHGMNGPVDWSPDGTRLVFHADTDPFEARLYQVNVSTGEITPLTTPGYFDESPAWTADGRGVLFMSTRGGNWTWALYRLDVASRALTAFVAPDWAEKNFPREGTDGTRLWIAADSGGANRLMRQRPGEPARVVTTARAGARWPEPSRDGSLIYTRMAHRVEYWMIDNPAGAGAPSLHATVAAAAVCPPSTRVAAATPHDVNRR